MNLRTLIGKSMTDSEEAKNMPFPSTILRFPGVYDNVYSVGISADPAVVVT
ncbi:hypothetical protein [Paenibacillus sp. SN-8-1]|uniref:hypothetical protein n=1 Tax=Paenibacillus sp. SN-8-1 TaxID=3435409 RepID=UPI003D9A93F2